MSKFDTVGHSTQVYIDDENALCCKYRQVMCARRTLEGVTLNSAGQKGPITKFRMNQFSKQYCNGAFHVMKNSKNEWVVIGGPGYIRKTYPFVDGMVVELPLSDAHVKINWSLILEKDKESFTHYLNNPAKHFVTFQQWLAIKRSMKSWNAIRNLPRKVRTAAMKNLDAS